MGLSDVEELMGIQVEEVDYVSETPLGLTGEVEEVLEN